jgi:ABC-type transport system involved in multi-copper enzyme maturation permease subunit
VKTLPFLEGARGVFELDLSQSAWSRRAVFMAILQGLPVILGVIYRVEVLRGNAPEATGFDIYGALVVLYYLGNALPLLALFYGGSLISDEVEGKTITYLLTRPLSRASILFGKFASYLATSLAFSLPPLVLAFFLTVPGGGTSFQEAVPELFRDLGASALALLVYGALFTLLGVVLKRPLIPGLLYLFVWELVVSHLPGYMPRLSVSAYLRSLVGHRPAEEGLLQLFGEVIPWGESIAALLLAASLALALASGIFSRREYVVNS